MRLASYNICGVLTNCCVQCVLCVFIQDGGKVLEEGMCHNSSMVECDIRLTEVGQESDYCISQVVRNNKNQAHRKHNTEENLA